jgi:hypothetical protein
MRDKMSNLIDLYNKSTKQRIVEARQIPGRETDFWDRQHDFSDGFTVGRERGDSSEFNEKGLNRFDSQVTSLVPPESFNPEQPLHRYTPETPFYNPGAPQD